MHLSQCTNPLPLYPSHYPSSLPNHQNPKIAKKNPQTMKNIYTKSKGKIHPSPSASSSADVMAVLTLLPPAILALTSALGCEDKEVVAYLVMRSINGPAAAEDRKRCRRGNGLVHTPLFDCGCFDCYTRFWSRWDCSPDREIIHVAIEGFEEFLASSERETKPKRRERREKKKNLKKEAAVETEVTVAEVSNGLVEEVSVSEPCFAAEEEVQMEEVTGSEMQSPPVSIERRRGWPDVMGMFNSRLWSLWSPAL